MAISERVDLVGNVSAQARKWARDLAKLSQQAKALNRAMSGGNTSKPRDKQVSAEARAERQKAAAMKAQARAAAAVTREEAKAARLTGRSNARAETQAARAQATAARQQAASAKQKSRAEVAAAKAQERALKQHLRTSSRASNDNGRKSGDGRATGGAARSGGKGPALPRQEVGGIGGAINSAIGNVAASAAQAALGMVTDFVASMGSTFIKARKFREESIRSLTLLTKSGDVANAKFKEAYSTARKLGLTQREVVESQVKLMGAGFKSGEADELTRVMADFKAGGFKVNTENFMLALSQIKGMGKATAEEMNQLVENSGGAISKGALLEEIAKIKKVKGPEQAMKLLEEGKVSAEDIQKSLVAVNEKRTGSKSGDYATKNADSLTSLMGRLSAAPEGFFAGLEMNASAGDSFKNSLKGLLDLLDPTTAKGEQFAMSFSKMIALIAGPGADAFARLVAKAPAIVEGFERMMPVFKLAGSAITWFADKVADVGNGIATVIGWVDKLSDSFKELTGYGFADLGSAIAGGIQSLAASIGTTGTGLGQALLQGFLAGITGGPAAIIAWIVSSIAGIGGTMSFEGTSIGTALVNGIMAGITGGSSSVISAAVGMATSAASAAKSALGIASPSKVFADLGEQLPAGLGKGMVDNMAVVEKSSQTMASGATGSTSKSLPFIGDAMQERGMGRQTTNNFGGMKFNAGGFNVGGPGQAQPADIAQDINRMIQQGIQNFMNKAAAT